MLIGKKSFVIKLLQSNRSLYVLRNFYKDTDKLFEKIEIETNSVCNRKCNFCPIATNTTRPMGLMKTELFYKILDELEEIDFRGTVFLFRYGEPLLDKRLEQFTKDIAGKLKAKIAINTNGDLLDYKRFQSLLYSGMDIFNVTNYDSGVSDSLKDLFENITKDEMSFINYEQKNENTLGLYNRGGSVKIKNDLYPISCNPMFAGVRHNGDVSVCCNDYYNEINFGNVNDKKLIDIWNSDEYKKFRKDIKWGKFRYNVCKKCVGIT